MTCGGRSRPCMRSRGCRARTSRPCGARSPLCETALAWWPRRGCREPGCAPSGRAWPLYHSASSAGKLAADGAAVVGRDAWIVEGVADQRVQRDLHEHLEVEFAEQLKCVARSEAVLAMTFQPVAVIPLAGFARSRSPLGRTELCRAREAVPDRSPRDARRGWQASSFCLSRQFE